MNWAEKLNKTELDHVLNDAKCNTLPQFKANRASQKEFAKQVNSKELCPQCKAIAVKIGIENW